MNIGIFLGHPAHFHYIKNVIKSLKASGHNITIIVKKKDILEKLLQDSGLEYVKIRDDRGNGKLAMIKSVLSMDLKTISIVRKHKIDLLVGPGLSFATKVICHKPVVLIGEDDADVVPLFSYIALPFCSAFIAPSTCDAWHWKHKKVSFPGYMELGYLHPDNFIPSADVVKKYGIDLSKPYFIIRFSSLNAHHDKGIKGISNSIAEKLIEILKPHGNIYITSERPLDKALDQYRIHINPLDMHHVMAFASLYIGDSQTMAAEAGVLGVPFVRFNDFVGRIGYLRELEDVYHLGYGIRANTEPFTPKKVDWIEEEPKVQPCGAEAMYKVVEELMSMDAAKRREIFQQRRQKMLSEKVDYAKFLTWFIENYPESKKQVADSKEWWSQFK